MFPAPVSCLFFGAFSTFRISFSKPLRRASTCVCIFSVFFCGAEVGRPAGLLLFSVWFSRRREETASPSCKVGRGLQRENTFVFCTSRSLFSKQRSRYVLGAGGNSLLLCSIIRGMHTMVYPTLVLSIAVFVNIGGPKTHVDGESCPPAAVKFVYGTCKLWDLYLCVKLEVTRAPPVAFYMRQVSAAKVELASKYFDLGGPSTLPRPASHVENLAPCDVNRREEIPVGFLNGENKRERTNIK